jgi:type II secretory pathway pseudopilin PulG
MSSRRGAVRVFPAKHRQMGGFLLEAALVLLITGVLTVSAFEIHSAMRKRQDSAGAKNLLRAVDAAIRAFALRENRLPCPSAPGSPVETWVSRAAGCSALVGDVPFVTLGLDMPQFAGWSFKYGISPALGSGGDSSLVQKAMQASTAAGSTAQIYVAGRDAQQIFTNCGAVALNPAYGLMWQPQPGPGLTPVPDLCLRENAEETMGMLAVGSLEFLGWLHAGQGR